MIPYRETPDITESDVERRFCRFLDEEAGRICGLLLPPTRNPVRLISARLGMVARLDLCDEHEQAYLQLSSPYFGDTGTGAGYRDLAAKVELSIHTSLASGSALDDATIRQALRVLKKLDKLPSDFRVPPRGRISDRGYAVYLENRDVLEELSPDELSRLAETPPPAKD